MSKHVTFDEAVHPLASKHEVRNEIEEPAILHNTPQTSLTHPKNQTKEEELVRKINEEGNELNSINSEEIVEGSDAPQDSDETTNADTTAARDHAPTERRYP